MANQSETLSVRHVEQRPTPRRPFFTINKGHTRQLINSEPTLFSKFSDYEDGILIEYDEHQSPSLRASVEAFNTVMNSATREEREAMVDVLSNEVAQFMPDLVTTYDEV